MLHDARRISTTPSLVVRAAICVLTLASHVVCMHAQVPANASKDELLHRIVAKIQQKDFAGALTLSAPAVHADPKDYRIWTLRGMAYLGLQDKAQAETAFDHALNAAPYYLPALAEEAQLNYQQGNDGARPLLTRILTVRPNDPTTHGMLAVLDYRKKDCASAIPHFQQAGEAISSQPDGLAMYGKCYAALSRYPEAIPVLEQALAIDATKQDVRYYLALCQWNADKNAEALTTLQPVLGADQNDERVLELGAGIHESLGNTQNAIDLLRQAILANPRKPDAYLQFAELTYEHGSPKIGIDFLNTGVTQMPREARLYLVRGVLLCQLGEFTKAFEDFQTANQYDPKLSYVDVAKGIVESQVHKPAEALAEFRAEAKAHPDEALAQYLFAEALSEQEKPNDAETIEVARRAVSLDPKLTAAQDLLAGLYLQEGDKHLAIEHSEAALAVDANDQQALYHLILALRDTERKGEIPALIKKMGELKKAERPENSPQKRLHQLSESSDAK